MQSVLSSLHVLHSYSSVPVLHSHFVIFSSSSRIVSYPVWQDSQISEFNSPEHLSQCAKEHFLHDCILYLLLGKKYPELHTLQEYKEKHSRHFSELFRHISIFSPLLVILLFKHWGHKLISLHNEQSSNSDNLFFKPFSCF